MGERPGAEVQTGNVVSGIVLVVKNRKTRAEAGWQNVGEIGITVKRTRGIPQVVAGLGEQIIFTEGLIVSAVECIKRSGKTYRSK